MDFALSSLFYFDSWTPIDIAQWDLLSQNFQPMMPKYYDFEKIISSLFFNLIFQFFLIKVVQKHINFR